MLEFFCDVKSRILRAMNKLNFVFQSFRCIKEHLNYGKCQKWRIIEQLWTSSRKPNIVEQTFDGKFKVCPLCNQEELELPLGMVEAVEANFRSWAQKDRPRRWKTGGQRGTSTISVNIENGPWNEESRDDRRKGRKPIRIYIHRGGQEGPLAAVTAKRLLTWPNTSLHLGLHRETQAGYTTILIYSAIDPSLKDSYNTFAKTESME